eukprot:COSAG05_NODE_2865_length_2555_cov_28.306471_3_plen_49_part_01
MFSVVLRGGLLLVFTLLMVRLTLTPENLMYTLCPFLSSSVLLCPFMFSA